MNKQDKEREKFLKKKLQTFKKEQRRIIQKRKVQQKERESKFWSPKQQEEEKKDRKTLKILLIIFGIEIVWIALEIALLMKPDKVYAMSVQNNNEECKILKEVRQEEDTIFYPQVMIHKEAIITSQDVVFFMEPNMDISKPTGISKIEFQLLLWDIKEDETGFFRRNADLIWELCQQGINEFIFCGIIIHEADFGRASAAVQLHNYGGMKVDGKLLEYRTEEEGLRALADNLLNNYLSEGGKYYKGVTLKDVNIRYCTSNDQWYKKVYSAAKMILKG